MAVKEKPCEHKTKVNKTVTKNGKDYKQKVCRSCGKIFRSEQKTDDEKGEE